MNGKSFFSMLTHVFYGIIFSSIQNQNVCLLTEPNSENKNVLKTEHQVTALKYQTPFSQEPVRKLVLPVTLQLHAK